MSDDNIKKYGEVCFTLLNGTYITGMDIPEGKYKLVAKHGCGDVYSSNEEMGINEYMEAETKIDDSDEDNQNATEFSNLVLKVGDTITIFLLLLLFFISSSKSFAISIPVSSISLFIALIFIPNISKYL